MLRIAGRLAARLQPKTRACARSPVQAARQRPGTQHASRARAKSLCRRHPHDWDAAPRLRAHISFRRTPVRWIHSTATTKRRATRHWAASGNDAQTISANRLWCSAPSSTAAQRRRSEREGATRARLTSAPIPAHRNNTRMAAASRPNQLRTPNTRMHRTLGTGGRWIGHRTSALVHAVRGRALFNLSICFVA